MEQTAVEWLVEQLENHNGVTRVGFEKCIQEAIKMERDNLILFASQCMVEVEKESGLGAIRIYELYFDKKFKSE